MSQPTCDAACRAKIILNGGRVRGEINAAVQQQGLSATEGQQLINILDEAEDKLIEWNNRRLTKTGYRRKTEKFHLEKLEDEV